MHGGRGNDDLKAGSGDDVLRGGPGADDFNCGSGYDIIKDFNRSEGDRKNDNCEEW